MPEFIVNRVQSPSSVLLYCILDEKIAEPEEIDAVIRKLGMPMDPFVIVDFTGIDISYYMRAIIFPVNPMGLIALIKDLEPEALTQRLENLAYKFNKDFFKPTLMTKDGTYR